MKNRSSLALLVIHQLKQRGFTLIELMVSILMLAILVAVAVPMFQDSTLRSTLSAQANDLMSGAILARSEAIKRNQVVTMCVSSNGTSCTAGSWEAGWIVISAANAPIRKHASAPTGYLIKGNITSIAFDSTGLGASMTSLRVCRATPVGSQERVVAISATGRPSITKTTDGTCAP